MTKGAIMIELDTDDLSARLHEALVAHDQIVLATSARDRVTARMVNFAADGFRLYVLTGSRTTKTRQIQENPRVGAVAGALQIEGSARILGHPSAEGNAPALAAYRARHEASYQRFGHFKAVVLLEITCVRLKLWHFEDGKDLYDELDLVKNKATRHG